MTATDQLAAVTPGDLMGALAATEALIAAGHRRIAHLPGEDWGEAARDRTAGLSPRSGLA